jgi:ribulose-5-phosphate 4-epimerase/fuculose-1-phosphate aldolase
MQRGGPGSLTTPAVRESKPGQLSSFRLHPYIHSPITVYREEVVMSETDALKLQLVDCIRMLEQSDIIDYNGHASVRVGDNRLLINIGSCQRSRLTVGDICTIDMEGNVIEGNGKPPLEFHLHAGIYRARADVKAIVHAHP